MGSALGRLVVVSVLAAYVLMATEWAFQFTRPSALAAHDVGQAVGILAVASLAVAVLAVSIVLVTSLVAHLGVPRLRVLAALVPGAMITITVLLLVENFTRTVTGFGLASLRDGTGWVRGLYAIALLLCLVAVTRRVLRHVRASGPQRWPWRMACLLLAASVVTVALLPAAETAPSLGMDMVMGKDAEASEIRRWNVVVLSTDGLPAAHVSAYGYPRLTTPFLTSMLAESLVCENSFTNAGHTTGAVASLLSGRLPTTTRVLYPPDLFAGDDAWLHLPGILRRHGYRCLDQSVRHYADPVDLGMRGGFDVANGRDVAAGRLAFPLTAALRGRFPEEARLLVSTTERVIDRVGRAFFLIETDDPWSVVSQEGKRWADDVSRLDALEAFIDETDAPFFAHVHLLGTHGPRFQPILRRFSAGREQDQPWMEPFFDDAVLDFDDHLRRVVTHLESRDLLDETVIVVTSDHGPVWTTFVRLPLLFRFPGGKHVGVVRGNTQRLDVAPTLLDALGLPIPGWMEGQSLLAGEPDPTRAVVMADVGDGATHREDRLRIANEIGPPFHHLGWVAAVWGARWFRLSVVDGSMSEGVVEGHTAPDASLPPIGSAAAREWLVNHLAKAGYDVSSLADR